MDRAWRLALDLAEELRFDGILSVEVKTSGDWWIVSADRDWLLDADGVPALGCFARIIRRPEAGLFAFRCEVVIAALSKTVVTASRGGVDWIVGEAPGAALPFDVTSCLDGIGDGRMVAFVVARPDRDDRKVLA